MASPTPNPGDEPANDDQQDPRTGGSLLPLVATAATAVVVLLVIFNVGGGSDDTTSAAGLDAFQFETPEGETISLDTYEGQPLVLNFFASWCAPCRAELPEFEEVHQAVQPDGITIVGISRDTDTSSWQGLIDETGITFDTVFEGSSAGAFEFFDAKGMPTTVFIESDGTVAEIFSGILNGETLRSKIDEHLLPS